MSSRLKIVTFDLEEFLTSTDPSYTIRYVIRRKQLNEIAEKLEIRLSGVDHEGRVVEFREAITVTAIDEAKVREWLSFWMEIIEKLGAKPGFYSYR